MLVLRCRHDRSPVRPEAGPRLWLLNKMIERPVGTPRTVDIKSALTHSKSRLIDHYWTHPLQTSLRNVTTTFRVSASRALPGVDTIMSSACQSAKQIQARLVNTRLPLPLYVTLTSRFRHDVPRTPNSMQGRQKGNCAQQRPRERCRLTKIFT